MRRDHLIAALQALAISIPLAAILSFVIGDFSWRVGIVAAILFAIIWIVMVGRTPKVQDSPQSDSTRVE